MAEGCGLSAAPGAKLLVEAQAQGVAVEAGVYHHAVLGQVVGAHDVARAQAAAIECEVMLVHGRSPKQLGLPVRVRRHRAGEGERGKARSSFVRDVGILARIQQVVAPAHVLQPGRGGVAHPQWLLLVELAAAIGADFDDAVAALCPILGCGQAPGNDRNAGNVFRRQRQQRVGPGARGFGASAQREGGSQEHARLVVGVQGRHAVHHVKRLVGAGQAAAAPNAYRGPVARRAGVGSHLHASYLREHRLNGEERRHLPRGSSANGNQIAINAKPRPQQAIQRYWRRHGHCCRAR